MSISFILLYGSISLLLSIRAPLSRGQVDVQGCQLGEICAQNQGAGAVAQSPFRRLGNRSALKMRRSLKQTGWSQAVGSGYGARDSGGSMIKANRCSKSAKIKTRIVQRIWFQNSMRELNVFRHCWYSLSVSCSIWWTKKASRLRRKKVIDKLFWQWPKLCSMWSVPAHLAKRYASAIALTAYTTAWEV